MLHIDLNCDCGEGYGPWQLGDDAALLPFVSSANIACGGHAGDPQTMQRTLRLCRELGVAAGAHPGYPDLLGFGRRSLPLSSEELAASLLAQLGALAALARAEGVTLRHIKPHGALYNDAAHDVRRAEQIVDTVKKFSRELIFVGLAGSAMLQVAEAANLTIAAEAFADRAYQADGSLRPRQFADALVLEPAACVAQSLQIIEQQRVTSVEGRLVMVKAQTVCLHGDHPGAAARAQALREGLTAAGIRVTAL